MESDARKCFESWSAELKSRSDRVRKLIGDRHWLSDGHHKEDLVRQFLIRHLPVRFRVTRGFMCPADVKRNISREIDVMVSDSEGELPWFAEGDLIIAPPSSVVAQIHIKTEFDVKELGEVLESGTENQRVYDATTSGRSLWFGAVFFSRTKAQSNDKMRKIWCSAVKKANGGGKRVGIPDCVAMIDGPVFLRKRNMGQMAEPCFGVTAYDCGNAAPAVFLSHFFDSVSLAGKDSTRRGEWFRMVTQLCKGVLFDESF